MIRRLRRDLSDQRISERYNVLLGDLSHRVIRAPAEKLQKLRKTATIKSHRRWSSLRLLAIKPIVQILAEAGPHNSFARKFLMQVCGHLWMNVIETGVRLPSPPSAL